MKEPLRGFVHSVESLSAVDGPGLRAVLFLQGCPLRCRYCHNPDTWAAGGGERVTSAEAAEKMLRFKPFLKSGGVTISGGEPLMQAEFVTEICGILRANGMHTAIDTGGGVFGGAAARALDACDLVILDIKHTDPKKYRELTGGDFAALTGIIGHLERTKKPFWVRQVVIGGVNDNPENIFRLKELAKNARKIELLPYHTMGVQKYAKLGLECPLEGVPPTSKTVIDRLKLLL